MRLEGRRTPGPGDLRASSQRRPPCLPGHPLFQVPAKRQQLRVATHSTDQLDADGQVDGRVTIPNFGPNFSVYDVNYDGGVDVADYPRLSSSCTPRPDFDCDGDVDDDDFDHWHECFTGPGLAPPANACYDADLDRDFDVDQSDFGILQVCLSGSGIAASPSCAE